MKGVSELKTERVEAVSVEPVAHSSTAGAVVILAVVVALSAFMLLPAEATPRMFLLAIFLSIIAVAICSVQAIHVALFSLLWIGLPFVFPALRIYPLTLLVPLVIYGMIITAVPSLRRSVLWLRSGRLDPDVLILVLVTIVLSGAALLGWYYLVKPDINFHLAQMPKLSFWMLPLAAIGFPMLNAAMEEFAFRGIIMQSLDSALAPATYQS